MVHTQNKKVQQKKILIDTNVILDFLEKRYPFYEDANKIMDLCRTGKIQGIISDHSIPTIWYIIRKDFKENEWRLVMKALLSYLEVSSLNKHLILEAINREDFSDFEDCLQDQCAGNFNADYIVTRNKNDFATSRVPAFMPAELLEAV